MFFRAADKISNSTLHLYIFTIIVLFLHELEVNILKTFVEITKIANYFVVKIKIHKTFIFTI